MKNIIILIVQLAIIPLVFIINSCIYNISGSQTEEAARLAFSTIIEWQMKLKNNEPFDYKSFCKLFKVNDALHEINIYEEKVRDFYSIMSSNPISAVGELIKIQKEKFLLNISKDNLFLVTTYTENVRNLHWIYAVLIPIKQKNLVENAYIRLGHDGRINIEESYIGNSSFLNLLGINNNGKIFDPILEENFLKSFEKYIDK